MSSLEATSIYRVCEVMAFSSGSSGSPGSSLVTESNKLRDNCTRGSSQQHVCSSFRGRASELLPPTPPLLLHKPAERKLKPDPIQAAPAKAGLSFHSLSPPSLLFIPLLLFLSFASASAARRSESARSPPPPARPEGQTPRWASPAAPLALGGPRQPLAASIIIYFCYYYYYSCRQCVSRPPSQPRGGTRCAATLAPCVSPTSSGATLSPAWRGHPCSVPPAGAGPGPTATHSPGHACHALGCRSLPLRCPARRGRLTLTKGDGDRRLCAQAPLIVLLNRSTCQGAPAPRNAQKCKSC